MSKSSPPISAPHRLNRWGIGTLSLIQLSLLLIALLALNLVAVRHVVRFDLSRDGAYQLSPATKRYLKSPAVAELDQPVKFILAYRRSAPFYERVRAIAEEYERLARGKIVLEVVDPIRSPDRTQQVIAAYGLTMVRDMLIIDARSDELPATHLSDEGTRSLHPQVRIAVADEIGVYEVDQKGQRRPVGFRGEDVMTARLVEALEGRPRTMLFFADKSQIDAEGENSPWHILESTMRYQNVELDPVQLANLTTIPEGVQGVALVAPKYDLTESEIAVLKQYWSRPRAAIFVMLENGKCPPRLRAFLRENGVTPRRDRIVSKEGRRLVTAVTAVFTPGFPFTQDLAGQTTVFDGASSSLEVREGAADLESKSIHPYPLVQAYPEYWGETRFGEGNESYDEREDHAAPLYLAAAVIRGAATDDRFAAQTARMFVLSNTDFLNAAQLRAENFDFLASSVNWLVQRESLAGIGPRSLGTYKLPLLDSQISFINKVNWFFLPGLLLVIGGFVWSSRRA